MLDLLTLGTLMTFLLVLPVIILIHEVGHAFFATLFGAQVTKISLGTGKRLFEFGGLEVNMVYFWSGFCQYRNLKRGLIPKIIIKLGGVIFNLLTGLAVWLATGVGFFEDTLVSDFVYISWIIAVVSLIPMSSSGKNTDGKQIYQLIRYGDSCYLTKDDVKLQKKADLCNEQNS